MFGVDHVREALDELDHLFHIHDAGTVAVCYAFGASPMRSIDQRAITKRFDYDGLGRLITKQDAWTQRFRK